MRMEDFEPELLRVAKLLHQGKLKPGQIDSAMVIKIANQLMKGIFKGYGQDLSSKTLTEAQRTFLTHIRDNVYVFSGFKNYQQLKETSLLLRTDDGKIKPFNKFLREVKQVDKTYNEVYLGAEYGNALASGQSAASWHDYKNNGIEVLTLQTVGDDRVRDSHRVMEGMTLDINDPLLDELMTPMDWGDRCEWIPGERKNITPAKNFIIPELPPMFRNNVGKTGIVFPDTHPYFEASKADKIKVYQQVAEILPKESTHSLIPANLSDYEKEHGITVDKEIFDYLAEPTQLTHKIGGAHYNIQTKTVNITNDERKKRSKWNAQSIVYHEFGHAADFQNGFQNLESVKDVMAKYRRKYKGDLSTLTQRLQRQARECIVKKDHDSVEQITASLDTIMSLNKKHGSGHGYKVVYKGKKVDYFDVPGFSEAEFIAHSFENRFVGNPIFKSHMPELYDDMIELTKGFKQK